jgi:uncharacterized membrane-anchored protein YhcB (DUF1043 family)
MNLFGTNLLSVIETLTFICLLIGLIYNRLVNWQRFQRELAELKASFAQYQKDVALFFESCKLCKTSIHGHHEDVSLHVTPDMRTQITSLVTDVASIKTFLMTGDRR